MRQAADRVVAKALSHTSPSEREAMLVSIIRHASEGLRIIRGPEHASEEVYRVADNLAARS